MRPILLVGSGGFIGAVARYLLSGYVQSRFTDFPAGTFIVNFLGSFILALVMYGSEYRGLLSQEMRIFITIGFLGAFTTMSTFNYETFRMLENGQINLMVMNIIANIFLGIFAIYLGRLIILMTQ